MKGPLWGLMLLTLTRSAAAETPEEEPRSDYRVFIAAQRHDEAWTQGLVSGARLALRGTTALGALVAPEPGGLDALFRGAVWLLIDMPIASYEVAISHELFGHGAWLRNFDGDVQLQLDLPLPYSFDADHAVSRSDVSRPLLGDEEALVDVGGIRAQEVMQRELSLTAFRAGVLRRGEAWLYAANAATQLGQTFNGQDMRLHSDRLGAGGQELLWGLTASMALDPLLWWSIYSVAYRHIWRGEGSGAYPALRAGRTRMSATSRVVPVPWGVEHVGTLLVGGPKANYALELHAGGGPEEASFGADLSVDDIHLVGPLYAGARAAMWLQPTLDLHPPLRTFPGLNGFAGPIRVPGEPEPYGGPGGAGQLSFEMRQRHWLMGTRLGVKSEGLWGQRPMRAASEALLSVGLRL